jgi:acyl carrier protein
MTTQMNEFLKSIAGILEVETVRETDDLKSFPQWDSLAVLSVIAMLDANYSVNLRAADFTPINSIADLWALVQSRKRS